ncbi:MAG TPA: hypothetical protein P5111_10030 [Kiritimatiellia bacterium]|nr:hypothetical protein [Kiritimatiellia bacterium]
MDGMTGCEVRMYAALFLGLTLSGVTGLHPFPGLAETATQPETVTVLTLNPYAAVDWDTTPRHRANLHAHSKNSDGSWPPNQVVDEYHQRGYTILALSDHNKVTYPWNDFTSISNVYENRDPQALGMLSIAGNELSRHHHTLSLFSDFVSTSSDWEAVLTALGAYSPEVRGVVCHPAMHWPGQFIHGGFRTGLASTLRALPRGDFTLETWFRTTDGGRGVLMGNYSTGHRGALNLELHTDNRVRIYVYPVSGTTVDLNLAAGDHAIDTRDGQWHHLAGVRRAGQVYLYLDGLEVGKTACNLSFDLQGDFFYLGRDTRTGSTEFEGDLDDARLWTRGLTAAEVAAIVAGGHPGDGHIGADNLLAHYAFERPARLTDTAGHVAGPFHAELHEPWYRVTLTPDLRQIARNDFTLEARFRTTSASPTRNILMGNYSSSYGGALNLELHTANRVRLYVSSTNGTTVDLNLSADQLGINTHDGGWHHLAGVRRGDRVYLYLDGVELGNAECMLSFDLAGQSYYVGRDTRTGDTIFKGDLDGVRLWARSLSAAEVAALATGAVPDGIAVSNTGLLAAYGLDPLTLARDSGGHPDGPFHAECAVFSSALRVSDVPAPLKAASLSFGAASLGWAVTLPTEVPSAASDYYADIFRRHAHLKAIEVINGTRPLSEHPLDRALWDALLTRCMPERPIWGMANDDIHSMSHLGREWSTFLCTELSVTAVREALDNGVFTFSSIRVRPAGGSGMPPSVERITHDPHAGCVTVTATADGASLPPEAYSWISMGQTISAGPVLAYRAMGVTGSYVRVEIRGPGGITFVNPFGLRQIARTTDSDADGLPDWWEWAYFGDPVSADAAARTPAGMSVAEHYIVGSDPHNPDASFRIMAFDQPSDAPGCWRLRWPSVAGRLYAIECATDLKSGFQPLPGAEAIPATPPYNAVDVERNGPSGLYRIRVMPAE